MGKNNKARRAAKAKARSQGRSNNGGQRSSDWSAWQPPGAGEPLFTQAEIARNLLLLMAGGSYLDGQGVAEGLRSLRNLPAKVVDREMEAELLVLVGGIWARGWQPSELLRQGRLGCSTAAGARLVALAIATDHVGRRSTTLDVRWAAQVESLDLPVVNGRGGWVARWAAEEGLDRSGALTTMVDALGNLMKLPCLEPILAPPGSGPSGADGRRFPRPGDPRGAETDPMLVRIRALLAKAESTSFEAEAIAFTAKAQELMTRHAIDASLLQSGAGKIDEQPVMIRLPIDAPYADAKSFLLQTVAEVGRCRAVFIGQVAMSSVVGFVSDLSAVELLFTSLLVQAQTALADAAKRARAGTRTRSQSYRSAFLLAYTDRIGDRLREINEEVFAEVEAEQGPAFLPVLRSRSATVDDYLTERFGELTSSRVRGGYDAAGWAGGRTAADNAQLNFGNLTDAEPAATAS
jgi:hypothetical protein